MAYDCLLHTSSFEVHSDHYNMVKCCQNVNFEEMDTERSTEKINFKKYIKQNFIMAVLRKTNSHSVVNCRLMKKSIM